MKTNNDNQKIKVTSQPVYTNETEELKKSVARDLLSEDKPLKELFNEDEETTEDKPGRPTNN